ncbi:hypothetical protein [Actinophytocola sediminis]
MAPQNRQPVGNTDYNSDGYNSQGDYDPTYDAGSSVYIDRGQTSDTGTDTRQDAEAQADAQEAGGNWLDTLINRFTREGRVETAYEEQLNAQAAELAEGVTTRPSPMVMCANYMSYGHPDLKTMVTDDVDPAVVGEMGDTWINAGNEMTLFQENVATAINNSEADWQGAAGNSARQFMADVGNWVGTAGQSAQLAGTQTNLQAESLSEAKRSMPEPVEFDAAAANQDLRTTTNPIEMVTKYANYMGQYNAQQEAHQQAAQVVGTYDMSLSSASTMPAFTQPPTMAGPGGSDEISGIDRVGMQPGDGGGDGSGNGSGGSFGSGSGSGSGGSGGGVPSIPSGGSGGSGGGSGGSGGSGGGFGDGSGGNGSTNPSAGAELPGPGPGPFPFPPGGNPPGNPPGGGNNPYLPPGPMPIGPGGGPGGGDLDRRGFGSGRGFGPGGGPGGGSGPGGFGSGSGSGSGAGGLGRGGMGPGGMGGAGAMAAENAAMRGGPGGGGMGGRGGAGGGMGGMGGARGQGEDDDEHQRPSFLVEGDPDAVFGTDEITAPSVIGE